MPRCYSAGGVVAVSSCESLHTPRDRGLWGPIERFLKRVVDVQDEPTQLVTDAYRAYKVMDDVVIRHVE